MTAPADPRPILALDVDGVLNPDAPADGFTEHPLTMPSETLPDTPFLRGYGREDLTGRVRASTAHGAWITDVRQRAHVVWATTWEHAANTHYAPLLGIAPLEVGVSCQTHPPRFGYMKNRNSAAWKAEALSELYRGRPVIWIDDHAGGYTRQGYGRLRTGAPQLVIAPDPDIGLTADHISQVEDFLAAFDEHGRYLRADVYAAVELLEDASQLYPEEDVAERAAPLRAAAAAATPPQLDAWFAADAPHIIALLDEEFAGGEWLTDRHPDRAANAAAWNRRDLWTLHATGDVADTSVRAWHLPDHYLTVVVARRAGDVRTAAAETR